MTRQPWGPDDTSVSRKEDGTLLVGSLQCKIDMGLNELRWVRYCGVFCFLYDNGVIHIPRPDSGRVGGSQDGSGFEVLYKQVCYQETSGGAHGHKMYQFIILTLEHKKGTF